jgi:hydrogenase 3 maturation protease
MALSDSSEASWRAETEAALSGTARIVVCGIGNDLRGDDAAGILIVRALEKSSAAVHPKIRDVLFLDGGETPENQTSRMRAFRPDLVVLVDAARSGRPPGEIFLIKKETITDEEVSTHRISLKLLVRFIEESIGPRVLFLGIEPESTEPESAVSNAVQRAIFILTEYLSKRLQEKI